MNQNQELYKVLTEADAAAFLERIHEPVFKASDMPLTYRVISHWHQENLFLNKQESGQWRLFSLVDYVWVLFINRLRVLDVGLKTVSKIKEQCCASLFPLLEQSIAQVISNVEPGSLPENLKDGVELSKDDETKAQLESHYLRVFSLWLMLAIKGNADVLIRIMPDEAATTDFVLLTEGKTDTEKIVQNIAKRGGLFISLQALLNEFYGEERFSWEGIKKLEIDKEAKTIIALMREKGLKQVLIKLEDGVVKHVQTQKKEQHMSIEAFNNAVLAKTFTEYKIVKNEGKNLIVSAKQNFRIKDGTVSR